MHERVVNDDKRGKFFYCNSNYLKKLIPLHGIIRGTFLLK